MRGNEHLKKYAGDTGGSDVPEQDDESQLPVLGDVHYKPHSRAFVRPVHSLHVIRQNGGVQSFQYFQMDQGEYKPGAFKLRFAGSEIYEVEVFGRNLWSLYDTIHQHKTAWVMEPPNDWNSDDGKPYIERIVVVKVEPEK